MTINYFLQLTRCVLVIGCLGTSTLSTAQVTKKPVKKTVNSTSRKAASAPVAAARPDTARTNVRVRITTDLGEIIVKLYDKTPLHRDNFIKLVESGFYDSLLFHRVVAGFMIQGGDPESKHAATDARVGAGGNGYQVPAEFDSLVYHKKGALAAARDNNPEKASSGCQFYIVHGKKFSEEQLDIIEQQKGVYFSPIKRMTYKMLGGAPSLDMSYTVFGEVEKGLEIVDLIANAEKNPANRPIRDIRMKMDIAEN